MKSNSRKQTYAAYGSAFKWDRGVESGSLVGIPNRYHRDTNSLFDEDEENFTRERACQGITKTRLNTYRVIFVVFIIL